uniref:Fanconi anemia, complementation group D2 n=1 Tax=Brugia pahangi TaxID=6280 RepID=A0A0N4TT47_BRUPA
LNRIYCGLLELLIKLNCSSGESKTGDIPDVSSVSDSKSMKKSVTGSDDMEEDETK